jgi:hypothetical protein
MFRDIYLDQRLNYVVDYFDKKKGKNVLSIGHGGTL